MNELARQEKPTWSSYISQVEPRFTAISKDNNQAVKWREESYFALQALKSNHYLAECAPDTVQNAIVNVAAVGLTLNPADGYAYLVPEYSKENSRKECQLRISFKGLIKAATDTGSIAWVKAEVVKKHDKFDFRGPCALPDHMIDAFGGDRGDSVGVYCIAKTNEGDFLVDIMPWSEVLKIKECAKTKQVWDKWPDEMAKKAIIKRAAKQWPKTERSAVLHKAIEVINENEGTENGNPYTNEEQEIFNEILENNDHLGFRLFTRSLSEEARDSLCSRASSVIPKGQGRVAMKKKIGQLDSIGFDLIQNIHAAIEENDVHLLAESIEDAPESTIAMLIDTLDDVEKAAFEEMRGAI